MNEIPSLNKSTDLSANSYSNLFVNLQSAVAISSPIFLGIGFDPRTNSTKNLAVKQNVTNEINFVAIKPEYIFEYVDSYTEMISSLNISMTAAYGASGASGGSASLSIMKNTRMESSSAYVVFKMRMVTKESTIVTANLVDDALKLLVKKNYKSFFEQYGTRFARSIYWGGELACIMEFSSAFSMDIQQFKAEIKAQVGVAKGEANIESSIMSLTRGRSVTIKYAQSGGATGSSSSGIFTATPDQLKARIIEFPNEIRGTDGLNGSYVSLSADMSSLRECVNWPTDETIDIDHPYPPNIVLIAESINLLQEKLVAIEGILDSKLVYAPSIKEAASELKPYLKFQISNCSKALTRMMDDPAVSEVLLVESFFQYRLRNLLGVASDADRSNSGGDCNLAEPDKNLLSTALFGRGPAIEISPWPTLLFTGRWGFQGQSDDGIERFNTFKYGTRVECSDQGGDPALTASILAGKSSPNDNNDGIFSYVSVHPNRVNGHHCGYALLHFSEVKILEKDRSILLPLPKTPQTKTTISNILSYMPMHISGKLWMLPFSVTLNCVRSCGTYSISAMIRKITEKSKTREILIHSYWFNEGLQSIRLSHPLELDEEWEVAFFTAVVDSAYCD